MAKWIVTGGLGFIGHHVVNALVDQGHDVVVIDNHVGLPKVGDFGFRSVVGALYRRYDVADKDKASLLDMDFEGADYVVHLAALPRVQYSIEHPVETTEANVGGTVAVLTAAHRAKVKRVVFASSSSIYGDSAELPLREDAVSNPMSPYALQKSQSEEWCRAFAREPYNLETVSLRFFNVYGPGADPNGPYALVVAKFLEQKRRRENITITGDGTQTRDFTHVRDVVRGILAAATSSSVGHGEVINLGGGRQVSVNEVARLIGGEVVHIAPRYEPHDTLASIEKAKQLLGWEPKVSFEDGIKELLERNQF